MHKLFKTDKNIAKELEQGYVVVMIDVNKEHNKDVDTKYGRPTQFGLPVIVVLDDDGKLLTTQDHLNPEKVMTFLKDWSPEK